MFFNHPLSSNVQVHFKIAALCTQTVTVHTSPHPQEEKAPKNCVHSLWISVESAILNIPRHICHIFHIHCNMQIHISLVKINLVKRYEETVSTSFSVQYSDCSNIRWLDVTVWVKISEFLLVSTRNQYALATHLCIQWTTFPLCNNWPA